MAKKDFLVSIDLQQNELLNAIQQNLGAHPTSPTPKPGQTYYNTASKTYYIYAPTNPNSDGTGWLDLGGSITTNLAQGANTNATSVEVTSSTGSSAILLEATTLLAGVLSATKFNEIVANTAKIGVTSSSVNTAGAVMNSDTSTVEMNFVVDEDAMTSNSDTKVPTQ